MPLPSFLPAPGHPLGRVRAASGAQQGRLGRDALRPLHGCACCGPRVQRFPDIPVGAACGLHQPQAAGESPCRSPAPPNPQATGHGMPCGKEAEHQKPGASLHVRIPVSVIVCRSPSFMCHKVRRIYCALRQVCARSILQHRSSMKLTWAQPAAASLSLTSDVGTWCVGRADPCRATLWGCVFEILFGNKFLAKCAPNMS